MGRTATLLSPPALGQLWRALPILLCPPPRASFPLTVSGNGVAACTQDIRNGWPSYSQVLNYSPVLGSFLIGSCIIFMTFVVLNLFISVILVAFSEEQKCGQVSEFLWLILAF